MRISRSLLVIYSIRIICVGCFRVDFHQKLDKLVDEIVLEYFDEYRCVTYITDERGFEVASLGRPVLLVRLFGEESEEEVKLLTESYEQSCGGYVVSVENVTRGEVVKRLIYAKSKAIGGRYNTHRYLFLPKNEWDVSKDILEDPKMFFMPNLVVVTPNGDERFDITTHTELDHNKRDVLGITEEMMDVWSLNRGFEHGNDLYPDKVRNVMGKKLIFGVLNYNPFSVVMVEGNETIFDGFETRIAAQFVKKINGTWEGLDHPVELWGDIYPDGSTSGLVGSIYEHRADIGFGAIYQWFCVDTDCSYPFAQSDVICLVPRPLLVSGWLTIVLPFTLDTWIALVVVYFFCASFVLFIILSLDRIQDLRKTKNLKMAMNDALFMVFRLQLEQIPRIQKTKEPLAVYVGISVYYYFFVAAFWQGGIASILTVPRYEPAINTATDMLDRWPKVEWGANSNVWMKSIMDTTDPILNEIVNKFRVLDDETLIKRTRTRDLGVFMERMVHGHYGHNDYVTEDSLKYLRLMEKTIYRAFAVFILPKGSPYSEKFDQILLRMIDTGLVHKMEVQAALERANNRLQNMIKHSNEKEQGSVILAVRHIEGPLYIYLVGMSMATVVFLMEKFVWGRNINRVLVLRYILKFVRLI